MTHEGRVEKFRETWRTPLNPNWKDGKYKERELARIRKYKKDRTAYINLTKQNIPCADCGDYLPPCAMDYDHRNALEKVGDINKLRTASFKTLNVEIRKCDLICANCHRIRTTKRKHGIPLKGPLLYQGGLVVTEMATEVSPKLPETPVIH